MKITAQFYSVDDAEFAAAALRRNSDGIFDITVNESLTNPHRDHDFAPIGFFPGLGAGSASTVPLPAGNLPAYGAYDGASDGNIHEAKRASLEIICRPSEAKRVSSALISHGGHELKGR